MDHTQAVRDLAFAPDGSLRLVSASLDRTIKVSKTSLFELNLVLNSLIVEDCCLYIRGTNLSHIFLLKFSQVWDLRDDGNMFKTLKGHSNEIYWCCWSPDAKLLASAGVGKSIFVWDMVAYSLARTLTGHHHNVSACEFSPDGAVLASSSWDTRVILWDPYTGESQSSSMIGQ